MSPTLLPASPRRMGWARTTRRAITSPGGRTSPRRFVDGGLRPALLLQLGRGLPQQQAGDDQQLDLLYAFEDVEDLDVAGPLLEQLSLAVTDRTGERDAAQRDVGAAAPRLCLGHRRL